MLWQAKMGLLPVVNEVVEKYLLEQGFEHNTFTPTAGINTRVTGSKNIAGSENERCLRLLHMRQDKSIVAMFVTSSEAYLEVTTSNGKAVKSNLLDIPPSGVDKEYIDALLNLLTNCIK